MSADLSAEVVIVGAGIAGALAAAGLARKGIDILIVEAGPRLERDALQARYEASPKRDLPSGPYPDVPYAPRPTETDANSYLVQAGPDPFATSYERLVGGTTWHWEATALRFLPEDFRMRSRFGLAEDWPLSYDDLEPWYAAAERELGVTADAADDLGSPRSSPYPMPAMPLSYLDRQFAAALSDSPYRVVTTPAARNSQAYAGRLACCGSGSCIPLCPTGAKYDAMVHIVQAEKAGARVVPQSVVTALTADPAGRISALAFKRPDGSEGRIEAKTFVLAAHGLETPKILLMSRGEGHAEGLANSSGQVGRNLMDHPYKVSWALSDKPLWPYRGPITLSSIENTRWGDWRDERPAYRISISNSGWAWPTGAPLSSVNRLIDEGLEGAELAASLREQTSRQVMLASMTEQLPDPENRIEPDFEQRDRIGIPRPKVTYRFDHYTKRGMTTAEAVHEEIFARIGTGRISHSGPPWGGAHIMGTYKMGVDPKRSVVDPNLRSHDHKNLFLLGSGVFPTGAAANPTLTLAALSLRAVAAIAGNL